MAIRPWVPSLLPLPPALLISQGFQMETFLKTQLGAAPRASSCACRSGTVPGAGALAGCAVPGLLWPWGRRSNLKNGRVNRAGFTLEPCAMSPTLWLEGLRWVWQGLSRQGVQGAGVEGSSSDVQPASSPSRPCPGHSVGVRTLT